MTNDILADFDDYSLPDWDGEGAEPIIPDTVAAARFLISQLPGLAATDIAPGGDGTIGFEWQCDGAKVFLDIKVIGEAARIHGSIFRFPRGNKARVG